MYLNCTDKNTNKKEQKIRIQKVYKRWHIKQTLVSLRLNEFKLTALTTSNGKLLHVRQTLLAKLNLRASSLHSDKCNLKLCPHVRTLLNTSEQFIGTKANWTHSFNKKH